MKQYFIKINPNLDYVHCGSLEVKNNNTSLNYYIKDQSADIISIQDALRYINDCVSKENTNDKKVIFYVHGFWASLSFALNRTATAFQKYYFKKEDSNVAAIVHLIWNANGLMYRESLFNIDDSKKSLALVLKEIPNNISLRYSLMCHSMGNRFLFETLKTYHLKLKYEELLMVAPDLDFKLFEQNPHLFTDIAKEVSVLYHKKDKTLKLSSLVNRAERLGRIKIENLHQKIHFIDFTHLKDIKSLGDKLMRHLYFITSKTVSKKIQDLLDN